MNDTHVSSDDFQKLSEAAQNIANRNLDIHEEGYRINVDALTQGELEPERNIDLADSDYPKYANF